MPRALYLLFVSCAENVSYDITCGPHVIKYTNGDKFDVDLKLENFPLPDQLKYKLFLYDGETLKGNVNNTYLRNKIIHFGQSLQDSGGKNYIQIRFWYSYNVNDLHYKKDTLVYDVIYFDYSYNSDEDCLKTRCTLVINWNQDCGTTAVSTLNGLSDPVADSNRFIPLLYDNGSHGDDGVHKSEKKKLLAINGNNRKENDIGSEDFVSISIVDQITGIKTSITYALIACSASVQRFDLLYMYQNLTNGTQILLKMHQHLLNKKYDVIYMNMNKTLQNIDKGSALYCVTKGPDNKIKIKSNFLYFSLNNDKSFEPLKDAKVSLKGVKVPVNNSFQLGEIRDFVCSGTPTLDGRNLTWYIQAPNSSEAELIDPNHQQYEPETNTNTLKLQMNETYHLNKLFCAEDYHLTIQYANESRRLERYGERARAEITLKLPTTTEPESDKSQSGLIWLLIIGIVVVLVGLVVVITIRKRRRQPSLAPTETTNYVDEENNESNYALTYVELQLSEPSRLPMAQNANLNYVEVVGVFNPSK